LCFSCGGFYTQHQEQNQAITNPSIQFVTNNVIVYESQLSQLSLIKEKINKATIQLNGLTFTEGTVRYNKFFGILHSKDQFIGPLVFSYVNRDGIEITENNSSDFSIILEIINSQQVKS
jgi:hypothetical protein